MLSWRILAVSLAISPCNLWSSLSVIAQNNHTNKSCRLSKKVVTDFSQANSRTGSEVKQSTQIRKQCQVSKYISRGRESERRWKYFNIQKYRVKCANINIQSSIPIIFYSPFVAIAEIFSIIDNSKRLFIVCHTRSLIYIVAVVVMASTWIQSSCESALW